MFDYVADTDPGRDQAVWSSTPVQPLTTDNLSPFSYSVVAEILGRAWYQYYDRLGFQPKPKRRLMRRHEGQAYLDISVGAALEAEHAGLEPYTVRINGSLFPVCEWQKPGLLGGLKSGRGQRKLESQLTDLDAELDGITTKARNWERKTREMKWSQAEILQVMEEIERVGTDSFMAFLAARLRLESAYNRLLLLTQDHAPFPANLALINGAVCDMQDLLEVDIAAQLTAMAEIVHADAPIMDWLHNGQFENWRQTLPSRELGNLLETFLDTYGHRCAGESDVRNARWLTNPAPVFQGIMACAKEQSKELICLPAAQNIQKLEDAAGAKQRKAVQSLLTTIHLAAKLQSRALNAVAYILAGTRNWALAAAREAMVDDRLHEIDEVFFFELEEMKEMMTGEWNLSSMDEIRATLERRRAEHPGTSSAHAAEILIGDRPIESIAGGLPGTSGHVNGPLRRWQLPQPHICNGAVVGVGRLDSGWSLVLPIVRGIVTAQGTPLDPIVAAARIWHTPTILAIGARYDGLVEGAQTTLDVEKLLVDQ